MKTSAEVDAARRAAILAHAPVVPKGACHMCDWPKIPRGALWCSAGCATDYAAERAELLGKAEPVKEAYAKPDPARSEYGTSGR